MKHNATSTKTQISQPPFRTDDTTIYDPGQGCNNCSIMWLLTFNILIQMISKVAIAARYSDIGHSETVKAKLSAYVDIINTHQSNYGIHTSLINTIHHGFINMFPFKEYSILKETIRRLRMVQDRYQTRPTHSECHDQWNS
jgi:hypothetical protein